MVLIWLDGMLGLLFLILSISILFLVEVCRFIVLLFLFMVLMVFVSRLMKIW